MEIGLKIPGGAFFEEDLLEVISWLGS